MAIGWGVTLVSSIVALLWAFRFYRWMKAQDEGDPLMVRIAGYVRDGANAYLWRQYRVVAFVCILISLLLVILSFGFGTQAKVVPFAFLSGAFFSALAGWFGMKTATAASSRTAQACRTSLNSGLQVAFRSGSVMGLTVVGLGLIDISLWFAALYWLAPLMGVHYTLEQITGAMLCFGMGSSIQSLFARVGGGIFTKAADVGADLVGKVESDIPEDDPRNPATIADNVGDNVGDVAGMGADLYESRCSSVLATMALGVAAFAGFREMQVLAAILPLLIAGCGNILSILGIYFIHTEEGASQENLLKALAKGINITSLGVVGVSLLLVWGLLVLPSNSIADDLAAAGIRHGNQLFGVLVAIVLGLFSGVALGWWTEYSTSDVYNPTRRIADQAVTGAATVIIAGIAEGFYSVWVPIVTVSAAIILAFGACTGFVFDDPQSFAIGLYGVAISSVGMLSTLGITLATDAYGPIADNAGGNAEMSKLPPEVRQRTDALDSLGNTTAATGKGFAIGSAALTTLALLAAYVEEIRGSVERSAVGAVNVQEAGDIGAVPAQIIRPGILAVNLSESARHELFPNFPSNERDSRNEAFLVFPATSRAQTAAVSRLVSPDVVPGQTETIDLRMLTEYGYVVSARRATIPDFVRFFDLSVMNPKVLVGMFLGVMLVFVFCAMTMKAVGRAAGAMVSEVRRQFREIAGIMEGTAQPDYASCVSISTAAAQREMIAPACLGMVVPVMAGLLLGVEGVIGMLTGGLVSGFAVAIMMANSGGAWDNAKKYIEAGAYGGKGTTAHKAAVVGDTVGDPFKDTSGPSLNILVKLMSMVSVVFAGLVVQYALNF